MFIQDVFLFCCSLIFIFSFVHVKVFVIDVTAFELCVSVCMRVFLDYGIISSPSFRFVMLYQVDLSVPYTFCCCCGCVFLCVCVCY